jgi:hypothetical protein
MGNKFNLSDLNKLKNKGLKINGLDGYVKSDPTGLAHIKNVLKRLEISFIPEHKFHPTRKWRLDIYLDQYNIGVEYEGVFSTKSRHTTLDGYTEDCNKYNAAASLGVFVFRYTAKNYKNFEQDIKKRLDI